MRRLRVKPGVIVAAASFAAAGLPGAAVAQGPWYLSGGIGLSRHAALSLDGGDNDRASRCDEFVNPQFAALPGCTAPNRGDGAVDDWMSEFGSAGGGLFGAAVGRRLGRRLRVEFEYAFADIGFDAVAPILAPSGERYVDIFGAELPLAQERIGTATARSLFVNLRFDRPIGERRSVHVGFGLGPSRIEYDYSVIWARNPDAATVASAAGLPNEAEVRANLAGTVSSAAASPGDSSVGYQFVAGIGHALSPRVTLDVQLRWTRLGDFRSAGHAYDRLRSHESNLRRDGSEPVTWQIATGDPAYWGLGIGLRHALR